MMSCETTHIYFLRSDVLVYNAGPMPVNSGRQAACFQTSPSSTDVDPMRALFRFVVTLILLVWMVLTCSACKEHFESPHGLTQHRRCCVRFKSRTHRLSQAYRQGYEELERPASESQSTSKAKIPRIEHSEPQNIREILRNRLHTVSS